MVVVIPLRDTNLTLKEKVWDLPVALYLFNSKINNYKHKLHNNYADSVFQLPNKY